MYVAALRRTFLSLLCLLAGSLLPAAATDLPHASKPDSLPSAPAPAGMDISAPLPARAAETTSQKIRPNPALRDLIGDEPVLHTGDIVRRDRDGCFWYVGRSERMIKSSGFRISPTEVEEVIFQSGRARHAAAIGIPDDMLGQAVKVFVVPRDGESVDTEAVLSFCSENMPRYMVPKFIEVLSELPKTSSGKVDYPSLRRREGL